MPIIKKGSVEDLQWCIWDLRGEAFVPGALHDGFFDGERYRAISHAEVRAQYIGARKALQTLTGNRGTLSFMSNGKPVYSENGEVSLSHTIGCAAACFHPSLPCGIDIEHQDRVFSERVIQRFAHQAEMDELLRIGAVHYWCAKEAVYKANGSPGLLFNTHIRVYWNDLANLQEKGSDRETPTIMTGYAITENKKRWYLQNQTINKVVLSTAFLIDK